MNAPVALVTGAGRGIGRAIALELGRQGWAVVVNYRSDSASASAAVEEIQAASSPSAGGQAVAVQADVSLADDRQRLLDAVQTEYNRLDVLVNNAGMAPRQRADLLEVSEASYDEVMAANLKGPFFLTQQAARWMVDLRQQGVVKAPMIVNIGSISAYTASINRGEYCISKAGLGMLTALFAERLAGEGILVYEVRPGIIETDMTAGVHEKYDRLIADGLLPLRRWGKPEDVARAVAALARRDLGYSTGEIINVDGGFHLRRL
jgi:NAD(P)-dependent dehydrogenase (short-subunit alcohol dehydrogenase family)